MSALRTAVFRADASVEIGTGHVMRCLTLADALRRQGTECRFLCRPHPGNLLDYIKARGYDAIALAAPRQLTASPEQPVSPYSRWNGVSVEEDAIETLAALGDTRPDCVVVDHYALDVKWESQLRRRATHILVIDDLANRSHDCDILVDQNLGRRRSDYENLVERHCTVLLGPDFALLRPDFATERARSLLRRNGRAVEHLLISLGGIDKDNVTGRLLDALNSCSLPAGMRITVVIGSRSPWVAHIREIAASIQSPTEVLVDVSAMAAVMAQADVSIGGAGGTAWERCCLGVPTLLVILAQNQELGARALASSGAAIVLGDVSCAPASLLRELPKLLEGNRLKEMSSAAAALCDGQGTSRVSSVLEYVAGGSLALRNVRPSDDEMLYRWANDPVTRSNAIHTEPIDWETHRTWFARRLADPQHCQIFIGELPGELPCGQVRFDRQDDACWTIDYAVAPEFRGIGLGTVLLGSALGRLALRNPRVLATGKVKRSNIASQRVFEKLGFHARSEAAGELISYRREAARSTGA
jgi:UDP-2,4-diacetamido-2,4,6-trideoxy-beta-L-altropyranose hydrolase